MMSHLSRLHPQALNQTPTNEQSQNHTPSKDTISHPSGSRSMVQSTLQIKKLRSEEINCRIIDEKLALMLAIDYQPFCMLEDTGFKMFVEALCSDYKIPDKRKIRYDVMPRLYKLASAKLKDILQIIEHVSLTCDMWSSRNMEAFLTVTAHFCHDGILRSCVLNTIAVPESHTADNLAERLNAILIEWNIKEKVVSVVTDNVTNMIKMCSLLELRHMPCFAHMLNLLVQQSLNLPELADLTKKCKDIAKFFHKSNVGHEALKREQLDRNPDKLPLKLIQEVPTRWNSYYYMFKRILELSDYLAVVQRRLPQAPALINLEEENILRDVVALLDIFEQATKMISADQYPTSSLIIPIIHGLYHNLAEIRPNIKSDVGLALFSKLKDNMSHRLLEYEKRTVCKIATFLHPVFRDSFRHLENKQAAKEAVKAELNNLMRTIIMSDAADANNVTSTENETACSQQSNRDKLPKLFSFLKKKEVPRLEHTGASAINVLKMYVETAYAGEHSNVIKDFWDLNKHLKPLDKLAKKYLIVPGTSVRSERVFSATGYIINDRRNSLKADAVEMICFLNQNQWLL
ncbi:E3 SUMO-protein ligase ZBED1-like [Epargyreus clarus]|uniref:E3 SUMO-protein ligase ZBED1-like n=1 Tax=Epargyreus clarus TaxID=520877 RepID=UPI003C2CBF03